MKLAIDVVLHAGRSAVDVALYALPITVLMTIVMRAHSRLVPPRASSLTLPSPKLRSEDCGQRHGKAKRHFASDFDRLSNRLLDANG